MIGRFAPSPTGPLHFGSLIAAVASYLCVNNNKNSGKWLLRIEDVDTGRIQKGATTAIIQTLEDYGFEWDGEISYQSQRAEYYQAALDSLSEHIYPCSCTRKSLITAANPSTSSAPQYAYIYPGFCRNGLANPEVKNQSIRLITNVTNAASDDKVCFQDQCQVDKFHQNINQEVGDFILKRSDGLWAYQLAVVVDDALQGITEVVRGADLFDNTPRQIYLQTLLGYTQPDYLHFPVAVDKQGKKLSKQNQAPALSNQNPAEMQQALIASLSFLGQNPPKPEAFSSLDDIWTWAKQHWDAENIPHVMTILSTAFDFQPTRNIGL